ncbi:MAG: hypothetical protein WD358_00855 [Nitriliruptoraceae bacterium]
MSNNAAPSDPTSVLQWVDTRWPDLGEPTGAELMAALDDVLAGRPVAAEQFPPMGCSIKWAPGNDPN